MISYIKGIAVYADAETILIENHGMGYQVHTTTTACNQISIGSEAILHTFLYVREDVLALYGFLTKEELRVFRLLLGVNGIGPKVALAVLSTLTVEDLYYAVISEDAKSIAKTPGIGPKGAKRLIMELKDKLELSDIGMKEEETGEVSVEAEESETKDAVDALIALGYSNAEAYRAVHKVAGREHMDAEQILREALKIIMLM